MKITTAFLMLLAVTFTALPIDRTPGPTSILVTPKAPKFTDAERHAELARRRAAVAARMADKSILVLFSAEPRLYTNDVDYVYRQENNLYYLTGLKQDGATLVITKEGTSVKETLFLPKRVPIREAWEGKMYSRDQATKISGITRIADASELPAFLKAVKERGTFESKDSVGMSAAVDKVYMLLPSSDGDENGKREYRAESEFAKGPTEQKIENARPIFEDLRHIKSP